MMTSDIAYTLTLEEIRALVVRVELGANYYMYWVSEFDAVQRFHNRPSWDSYGYWGRGANPRFRMQLANRLDELGVKSL